MLALKIYNVHRSITHIKPNLGVRAKVKVLYPISKKIVFMQIFRQYNLFRLNSVNKNKTDFFCGNTNKR